MVNINVRGYEFKELVISGSSNRKAIQFQNNIIDSLKKIGLTEDDVNIPLENIPIKRAPASATWYVEGQHLYFSYSQGTRFIDNLYIISKVIELEVEAVLSGKKTLDEFIIAFSEDSNIIEKRKEARKILGVDPDTKDMEIINKQYKILAKKYHPDTDEGNIEMFKKINNAHKMLKRELE